VNSDEIRTAFLKFFAGKRHKVIPSSSLIPHNDPTLLLTSAGMVQMKPYFTGELVPENPRMASCQKCFRTTDIESVGDATHCTFFEMLGNFSVGDYFKREAIEWGWEFVTENLKIPTERLWITVFLDDDEAFNIWREIGIPEKRILRFGEEDNFWGPAGSSGPCGPCSEIFYDFGEEFGCGKPDCAPNCECNRFTEIWNLVFTQYDQDEDGKRTPLPKPNIDTGMGVERMTAAMQHKPAIYGTDLFTPLLQKISSLTGKEYGSDNETDIAMRVVAEHGRGISFLIADGVMPGNEGRGYVLRRLLRRAALFGLGLGLDKPFLSEIARVTIQKMGDIYSEIRQKQDFITKVIELEETRFSETLRTGVEMLEGVMSAPIVKKSKEIPGKEAFKLYDTYGFPVELTSEIAEGRGFFVDLAGFEKEMEEQRERAKEAQKFDINNDQSTRLGAQISVEATPFVGYHELKHRSGIIGLITDNQSVDIAKEGQEASLVLESTPFYGEMGGQVGDTGEIRSSTGRFTVTNTIRIHPDIIVHQGSVCGGSLKVGDVIEAQVDTERRLDIARNHTATHLLQYALRKVLGSQVEQRGSLVTPDRFRFDFSHLTAMMPEEIEEVLHIVNEKIRENLPVYDEELSYQEAVSSGAIALFDEKYGDVVRVLKIGKPFISAELCGGTHVTTTGEIGFFQIISESSIGAGLRRIEAVTGMGAERLVERRFADMQKIAEYLDAEPDNILEKAQNLSSELKEERRQFLTLERELSRRIAESLLAQVQEVNGITLLTARIRPFPQQVLREMGDLLRDKLKSAVIVLGTVYQDRPAFLTVVTSDLVEKGYNAGDIVKQVAKVTGGGGGGKATMAQAGGRNKAKLDEALELVKSII